MSLGKYLVPWVFSLCQLAAVRRGGSRFWGCLVTSLPYFLHLAFPANLLGPSSQAHQLVISLLKTILRKYYNILRKNYIVHLTLFIFFSTFCKHITCWRPWIDCSISVKVMWLKEFCPKFFLLHLRTDRAILKTNHHKIKFLEYFLEGKQLSRLHYERVQSDGCSSLPCW